MNELAWAMLALVLVLIPLFSYLLTRYYSDPSQSTKLTSSVTTAAISLSLITVLLVPIDIYTVSANIDDDGMQKDPDATQKAGDAVKVLYYILYSTLLAFAFAIMPFVYFFFEEEDEESTPAQQAWGALKYTIAFIIIFAVLIALGIILKNGKFANDADGESWIGRFQGSFGAGDSIMAFSISCLACLGLFGWLAYTAYGLAAFPITLMRSRGRPTIGMNERGGSDEDVDLKLRKVEAEIKFLTARYEVASRKWTPEDKKQYQKLKREENHLNEVKKRRDGGPSGVTAVTDWFSAIWNAFAPIRIIVGLLLLGLSFLIVISYMLSAIDQVMHSSCKAACGYTLDKPHFANPVDLALNTFAKVFPIDYIAFGGITLYMFLCSLTGVVAIGVRLLIWKLYDVERKKTMPHGLIFGAWLLMFVVLLMNMELLSLAPDYVSFGNQFYTVQNNGTSERYTCDQQHANVNNTCIMTQVASFINRNSLANPFFGVIFFFANFLFFAAFIGFVIYAAVRTPSKTEYHQMQDVDEDF